MSDYRRPGVYLEERLQTSPTQLGGATAVGCFAGVTAKGPGSTAVRVDSWSDFVQQFGGFAPINVHDGTVDSVLTSYLPYAVFAYYQNGGRAAYIVRVLPAANRGTAANFTIMDATPVTPVASFLVTAGGVGTWGNALTITIAQQTITAAPTSAMIFSLSVADATSTLETFTNLSMAGVPGTRPVLSAINDPVSGSRYITVAPPGGTGAMGKDPKPVSVTLGTTPGVVGVNPATPVAADLTLAPITTAMRTIESPLIVSFQPFMTQAGAIVMPVPSSGPSLALNDHRSNCFIVWDGKPLSQGGANYVTTAIADAASIVSDSYSAFYVPWIVTPDPSLAGATITVPPSGSLQGMMARIDATTGPWRAPAGTLATLSTAVQAEARFSDTDQGQMNSANVNVIRPVPGAGICCMGGRTRKLYGPDRYVSDRRTLIYIEEMLKNSTQWAVFQNNDIRLWSSLRNTAQNILQPIWEAGGLAGQTAADAYYVICDGTINNPQVVQAGEVRMEVGVALQYPAEFVVIRISQFDSGASVSEVTTA